MKIRKKVFKDVNIIEIFFLSSIYCIFLRGFIKIKGKKSKGTIIIEEYNATLMSLYYNTNYQRFKRETEKWK